MSAEQELLWPWNRWYAVALPSEIGNKPVQLTRLGTELVLWRTRAGALVCLANACPHRGVALSLGKVREDCIECPFHGFRFAGDGRCTAIPTNGNRPISKSYRARSFPVREVHGWVWLWWGEERVSLPAPPYFEQVDDSFHSSCFTLDWPIHYGRVIENNLDFAHLPFVHQTTIGRGFPVDVTISVEQDGDRLRAWPGDANAAARDTQYIELLAPNLWINQIGSGLFVTMAVVPVDGDNTRMYVRFYQNRLRIPGLRWLFGWVMNRANRVILAQDRRIVLTHRPGPVTPQVSELLVATDAPIRAYRTWVKQNARASGAQSNRRSHNVA